MKASLFPNSAALVLSAMALGSLLMGQPYPRARADEPVYDLLSTGKGGSEICRANITRRYIVGIEWECKVSFYVR